MGNIVLLDDLTINKIAAGEVIERPANVVKELVENSIDAGATSISVDIENGGISYIRIVDNGRGIAPDDVEIAFERHATSKIRSANDLIKVVTMGFRGEALASIAAIANVELITRTANQEMGTKIVVEGGKILEKEEWGAPVGTSITVRNLFFNTPVRYKFLKKDFTESGYIEDIVSRIALIHPLISFRMKNGTKEILRTNGNGDMTTAVYSIFGKDIAENVVPVDSEFDDIKITGVVGKPEIARSNRSNQLFYINGRYIKDKLLMAATEEAYRTLIPNGKFGFCILNMRMAPERVDVNVHPAKLEVRFSEEGQVFKAVNHAIKSALLKNDLTREEQEKESLSQDVQEKVEEPKKKSLFDLFKPRNEVDVRKNEFSSPTVKEMVEETSRENKVVSLNEIAKKEYVAKEKPFEQVQSKEEPQGEEKPQEVMAVVTGEKEKEEETSKEKVHPAKMFENLEMEEKSLVPEYKIIGTAFSTYILLQLEKDIYILDQHAAHERVLYEKVKKNFYSGGKETQMLLLPDVLNLPRKDMNTIRNHKELFEHAGFLIEEFGENAIKIEGVPTICFDMNTKDLFLDILDGIDITNRTNKQEIEEKFIATVACKAAVKANMELDTKEIEYLLNDLLLLDNPFTCPHGRPTAIRITKDEIEKKFGRK